jgi:hypothetical protein
MAKCSTCGNEGNRVRSRWNEKGIRLPDECPSCAPGSFDKFTAPSDKKIWMGWEAHPNEYAKVHAEDGGVIYNRKPEYRAEQEAKLALPAQDEQEREGWAIARKRRERRTIPMDESEMLAAISKARKIAAALVESADVT